jgi:thiol:disulfide interchange protein DsbD
MYKARFLLLLLSFLTLSVHSQIYDPVTWEFSYEKKGDKVYELIFIADIVEGSHIYSMDIPEGGPIPTSFSFDTVPDFLLVEKAFEVTKPEEIFDEAFEMKIRSFSNRAEFRQKVTGNSPSFTVSGAVNFMACNNVTCSPPKDVEFVIKISNGQRTDDATIGTVQGGMSEEKGLWKFFIGAFLLGLVGVLTPCVYPMIPMTVAFFTRESEKQSKTLFNALLFGLSIVVIYTLPGIIISITGAGAGFANALSTHWIANTIFFLLFLLFGISFLGAFEIMLPNKWASGADSRVDKGGIMASFFLALTTVIVSFSCTGPIVGGLLVEAARGDVLRPSIGMFAFGLAFALPFTLFALFPSILGKLPKSGGWLNSIKVVLAFIMLAFSLKFLMTIDAVYSFNLLSRDIYLSIWIVLFTLLGFYLLGKIKFAHDSDLAHIGTVRFFLVVAVFSFVVYLLTGLFGAPLKGIASLLPPQETSWFRERNIISEKPAQTAPVFPAFGLTQQCSEPKFGDKFKMPHGLTGYFDFKQGLACAKEQGKPALIDFKGHACANCKLMEARVWSDPEILKRLRENFVIIALYVDDRTQLPEDEWIVSLLDGKQKKTIGKINEDLEITKFKTNALPLYVIAGHDGNPLNTPTPTNLNVEEYKQWLDEGLRLFNNKK